MSGVYISYPFCNQKCSFCNFASDVYSGSSRSRYEEVLLAEVQAHSWDWPPETLYFGGGTPSLMSPELLRGLTASVPASALTELTMECAPGTVTPENARLWAECGVNRVSLGVQSFADSELRQTGRRHNAVTVANDVELLRGCGICNINIDLIAGLPTQTEASWEASLDWIDRLTPPHVSIYIFEVDEDSRLGNELILGGNRYGTATVPSEDLTTQLYERAVDRLAASGILRYEISNFARPGMESRHNLKYWLLEPYIGFGLDAHSFDGHSRWGNPDNLETYLSRAYDCERTQSELTEEHFFVGLRLASGIEPSPAEWRKFSAPVEKWTEAGLMIQEGARLRLSDRGFLLSNEILQEFVHV